jgi:predicted transcriptional regulator of viral defense system
MMTQVNAGYSQSLGVRLLETAVREVGPIFSLAQIKPFARELLLTDAHLHTLISSLAGAGWLEIIKRGNYLVRSPFYPGEIPPFAVAAALIQPMAISHWSACAHHGFITQSPGMVQASTPGKVITPEMRTGRAHSPRGRAAWRVAGLEFEFIHVKPEQFWGFEGFWVSSWQQVDITDPERTALDLFVRPDVFGGVSAALEIMEAALPQIKVSRLVEYSLKYGTTAVIRRLDRALKELGVDDADRLALKNHPAHSEASPHPSRRKAAGKPTSTSLRIYKGDKCLA